MSTASMIAIPAAIVLALASTATAAQDKPGLSKPVTTLSKSAKQEPAAAPQDAAVKTVKQGTEKEISPSATQSKPISDRSYEGCHHSKDSDA
jgi:hypothetical protein